MTRTEFPFNIIPTDCIMKIKRKRCIYLININSKEKNILYYIFAWRVLYLKVSYIPIACLMINWFNGAGWLFFQCHFCKSHYSEKKKNNEKFIFNKYESKERYKIFPTSILIFFVRIFILHFWLIFFAKGSPPIISNKVIFVNETKFEKSWPICLSYRFSRTETLALFSHRRISEREKSKCLFPSLTRSSSNSSSSVSESERPLSFRTFFFTSFFTTLVIAFSGCVQSFIRSLKKKSTKQLNQPDTD